jgi:hypothetical protein
MREGRRLVQNCRRRLCLSAAADCEVKTGTDRSRLVGWALPRVKPFAQRVAFEQFLIRLELIKLLFTRDTTQLPNSDLSLEHFELKMSWHQCTNVTCQNCNAFKIIIIIRIITQLLSHILHWGVSKSEFPVVIRSSRPEIFMTGEDCRNAQFSFVKFYPEGAASISEV